MSAAVVARNPPFVGLVLVGFRSAIHVWKRTYGVSPVVGFIGSVLIVGPLDLFDLFGHLNVSRYKTNKASRN